MELDTGEVRIVYQPVDSGPTAARAECVDCALEQSDLPLMIRVVLEQSRIRVTTVTPAVAVVDLPQVFPQRIEIRLGATHVHSSLDPAGLPRMVATTSLTS